MAHNTNVELNMINPYRLWSVVSYDNCGGDDHHYVICYFCIIKFHYNNEYNIVISALEKDSVANEVVLSNI